MNEYIDAVEDSPELDIPPEALDYVVDDLPSDYMDEIMAIEVLSHISNYHALSRIAKASRHGGDNAKATDTFKAAATERNAAALIQYEFPNTKIIYKELAEQKTRATKMQRAAQAQADV